MKRSPHSTYIIYIIYYTSLFQFLSTLDSTPSSGSTSSFMEGEFLLCFCVLGWGAFKNGASLFFSRLLEKPTYWKTGIIINITISNGERGKSAQAIYVVGSPTVWKGNTWSQCVSPWWFFRLLRKFVNSASYSHDRIFSQWSDDKDWVRKISLIHFLMSLSVKNISKYKYKQNW